MSTPTNLKKTFLLTNRRQGAILSLYQVININTLSAQGVHVNRYISKAQTAKQKMLTIVIMKE